MRADGTAWDTGAQTARCRLPRDPATVAVVGGGASGTLTAVELIRVARLRGRSLHVLLVDAGCHGLGVAYATTDPQHRLNVPAGKMSALADDPDHLLRWGAEQGLDIRPDDFLPRGLYGRYLQDLLAEAQAQATGGVELTVMQATATGLLDNCVVLDGSPVSVDAKVLAPGNPPPVVPDAFASHPGLVRDPWADGALDDLEDAREVLLVGTGLTMIDVAMTLAERAPNARMVAVSRRGLLPRTHAVRPVEPAAPAFVPGDGPVALDDVIDAVDEAIAREPGGWRAVVDGLRPVTQEIWQALSHRDRKRFIDGPARRWEVHRHRMAPQVAARVDGLRAEGRLRISAGRPGHLGRFEHVVACTGPDLDIRRSGNPLLRDLIASGRARLDPLALGLDTGPEGELIGADGQAAPCTLVVGPLRRGALYESTAIPEIRCQAARVADLLVGDVLEPSRPLPAQPA
jgi:uncharacterized NAD(P)/FAD-binding protein YdhS